MAGGITDLASFSANTPLDVVSGGSSLLSSGIGIATMSNPYMAAFQIASQLFNDTSIKISKANTNGFAESGISDFANNDTIDFNERLIDLSKPKGILIALALVVGAIYIIKKIKR